jgi:hypothetical protein
VTFAGGIFPTMPGQNAGSVGLGGTAASAGPRLRDVPAFVTLAVVMIVAGGLVAAVNSAAPFAHGSWLAAYLVLVGGVSQLVLCGGRFALPAPRRSTRLEYLQFVLWNAGIAGVAVGVFADGALVVSVGSAMVLAA